MSNMYEDEYETPAIRVLREKAEADSALLREMSERLEKAEKRARQNELENLVNKEGFDPKVVTLVPADADPAAWLKENAALLAKKAVAQTEAEVTPAAEVKPDLLADAEADALAAIAASAAAAAPVTGLTSLEAQIKSADSPEAVAALLAKELGGVNPMQVQ